MSGFFGSFVVPDMLANPGDLAQWTGTAAPANATQILRSCTSLVLEATEGAYYDVDPATGLATDAQILKAMQDATCIQAAAWIALKIDPSTGGVLAGSVAGSKKIGTAQIVYDSTATASANAARAAAYSGIVPDARRKLQQNNLIGTGAYDLG